MLNITSLKKARSKLNCSVPLLRAFYTPIILLIELYYNYYYYYLKFSNSYYYYYYYYCKICNLYYYYCYYYYLLPHPWLRAVVSPLLEDSSSVSISAITPSTALVESDTASIYATTSDTSQRNRGVDTQGAIVNVDNSFSDGTPLRSLTVPRTRKKYLDEAVLEPKQPEDTPSHDSLKKPRR